MKLPQFFYLGQTWHIEQGAALHALSDFANDLAIVQAGGKWSETGAAQKKASFSIGMEKNSSGGTVAVIPLEGVMRMSDGLCSSGIQSLAKEIRKANADQGVSAIVIEANTGGGEAIAGQELANAIAEATKPVLFYAHFLASAGVMAALSADEIYASGAMTEIGSIGVKATVDNEMLAWYTETFTDYYADTSGNKNEEFRALQNNDPSKLIASLNKADTIFMDQVRRMLNLKGSEDQIRETLSGRMFFAEDAKKRGLITGIKTKSDVILRAQQLASQYRTTGRPNKKDKKMANILAGTVLGNILGIKEGSEDQDEKKVFETLEQKFSELESANAGLTKKLSEEESARKLAESKAEELAAKVSDLEAISNSLTEKSLEINKDNEDLKKRLNELEEEKTSLSKKLAVFTVRSGGHAGGSEEIVDAKEIEKSAKISFGGEVEVK